MSAVDFLLPVPVQRMLGAVLMNPHRIFLLQDLVSRAGAGVGNARRHLNKLLAAGILSETERLGRERRFKANTEHFLFPELQGIARKTFGLVAPIRDALAPFEGQIQQAFVFGSVVTGKDTARSDVDVLVVGDASYLTLIMAVTALEGVLGRPVHLNLYAPAEWARLIAEDGVIQLIAMGPRLNIFPRPPEEGESQ